MSNASRLVDKLKAKHLVERRECPTDRRQVDILITDKGLNLLGDLQVRIEAANKQLLHLNEEEVGKMNELLDKLRG